MLCTTYSSVWGRLVKGVVSTCTAAVATFSRHMHAPIVMRTPACVVTGAILALGCHIDNPSVTRAQSVKAECPRASSEDYYFPVASLGFDPRSDDVTRRVVSAILARASEMSLSCNGGPVEAYRITWVHAFTTWPPLVVSVANTGGGWRTRVSRLEETPQRIKEGPISDLQAKEIVNAVDAAELWKLQPAADDPDLVDGGTVVAEGRRAMAYHAVRRRGEFRDGSLRRLMLDVLKILGVPAPQGLE